MTAARNVGRLPAYSRLDVRADRTFTYRRSRLTVFAEVVNALNRSNYRAQGASLNRQHRRDLRRYTRSSSRCCRQPAC